MSTIFALVNIPKNQLKGAGADSSSNQKSSQITNIITRPKYETEREVTLAIVNKELKFGTEAAYAAAREYQKSLKR